MPRAAGSRKAPLTVERVVDAALAIAQENGYHTVTMRSVAARLRTGPSSLYAHVSGKDELDQHIAARLIRSLQIPDPDPDDWRDQLVSLYQQLAELFVHHPGIERAYFASGPRDPAALETIKRATAIYNAGGLTAPDVTVLEPILEAMAISHAIQTTVLHQRLDSLGATYEELAVSWGRLLDDADERVALATDLSARESAFADRLRTVIDSFAHSCGVNACVPTDDH